MGNDGKTKSGDGLTAAPVVSGIVTGQERSAVLAFDFNAAITAAAGLNSSPKAVTSAEWTSFLTKVNALVGATDDEKKGAVVATLIWTFATNGTGPNAKWHEVPFNVTGCRETNAFDIVKLARGRPMKHFMVHLHDETISAYKTSQMLRDALTERATRSNLSEDEGYLVIDYLDAAKLAGTTRHVRQVAKDTAILRQRSADAGAKTTEASAAAVSAATAERFSSTGPIAQGDRFGAY